MTFLTLASGKSKRFPNKNITDINGKPLIQYTIDFVKDLQKHYGTKSKYYIVTDCKVIEKIALKNNVQVLIEPVHNEKRTHAKCMDLMRWVHKQINDYVYFMFPATSPVRYKHQIIDIIDDFFEYGWQTGTTVYKKDRNNYIHNGSIWMFREEILKSDDIINEITQLYIDDSFFLDIDTQKDIDKFKLFLEAIK